MIHLTTITGIMPNSGRYELVYLCIGRYVTDGRCDRQFSIVVRVSDVPNADYAQRRLAVTLQPAALRAPSYALSLWPIAGTATEQLGGRPYRR